MKKFKDLSIEEKLALHRAHYEGKEIQIFCDDNQWHSLPKPVFQGDGCYRVNPEKIRIFKVKVHLSGYLSPITALMTQVDYYDLMCHHSPIYAGHLVHNMKIEEEYIAEPV